MNTRIFRSHSELKPFVPLWDDLAAHASEPNVFFESWLLLPSIEFIEPGCIVAVTIDNETGAWTGLFPFRLTHRYRGLPITHLTSYKHQHSVLSTPLIRKGFEVEAWGELFRWIDASGESGRLLELTQLGGDGPVYQSLCTVLDSSKRKVDSLSYVRALLSSTTDLDTYLHNALSGKRLKEFRRLKNRLSETGTLTISRMNDHDSIDEWLSDFLDLENRGWKGEHGTALAVHESERVFFETITREAFARKQLIMNRICIDERPIAMKCSYRSGNGSFALKIAYDEAYARYSPGVLLELENIAEVLADPSLDWMDSCAIPDHFMINRLWTERRTVLELIVSTNQVSSRVLTSGLSKLRKVYRTCMRSNKTDEQSKVLH